MRSPLLCLSLAVAVAVAACGDDPSSTADAARTDGAVADGAIADAPAADGPDDLPIDARTDAAPSDVVCTPGTTGFTLGVSAWSSTAAIPAGRLAVMFWQVNDDLTPYPAPVLGLDLPFAALAAGETRCVDVDLAGIQAPAADAMQLCDRTCGDLTMPACACPQAGPRVAIGYVLVARDASGNGQLEAGELVQANVRGGAWMVIGASPAARADGAQPPSVLDLFFPDGVEQGVRPYRVIDTDSFDRIGPHQPGTIYQLRLCAPGDATCRVRFPNIT